MEWLVLGCLIGIGVIEALCGGTNHGSAFSNLGDISAPVSGATAAQVTTRIASPTIGHSRVRLPTTGREVSATRHLPLSGFCKR